MASGAGDGVPAPDRFQRDRSHHGYNEKHDRRSRGDHTLSLDNLTPEEKRVISECKQEKFYYRTLPFSVTFAGAAHFATMKGLLNPHPKYGSLFKCLGAAAIGCLIGEFSYFKTCKEKILREIPNSNLAQVLKTGNPWIATMGGQQQADSDQGNITESRPHKDDYDGTVPVLKGLDDSDRPTIDFEKRRSFDESSDISTKPSVSYDILRQKNRDEYSKKPPPLQQFDRRKQTEDSAPFNSPQQPDLVESSSKLPPKHTTGAVRKTKNEYGDVWDE